MALQNDSFVDNKAVTGYLLSNPNGLDLVNVVISTPQNVHRMVQDALRRGLLKKSVCTFCKSARVIAHHQDYSRPFDVVWMCHAHHVRLHRAMRESGGGPRNIHLYKNREYNRQKARESYLKSKARRAK